MNAEFFKIDFILNNPINLLTLPKIRGYLGHQFKDNPWFHQHQDNKVLYRYPFIQYKVLNNHLTLLGLQEGAQTLQKVCSQIKEFHLDNEQTLYVKATHTNHYFFNPKPLKTYTIYQFLTPYFALNKKNYQTFQNLSTMAQKKEFFNKILTGNILSFLKSLSIWVESQIIVDIFLEKSQIITFKGQEFTGLKAEFACNFDLPSFIGLGKSVSRGFGTIINRSQKNM